MPADIHSTSQSGERARARASSELRLLDLDDLCLSEILVRAVLPQRPWESDRHDPFVDRVHREEESWVYCGRVLRVCRRFRDALLLRATGRWVGNSHAQLRFAPRLRRLEIASHINRLPVRAERSGDSLIIVPPALAHLTNVTQLEMRGLGRLDAGRLQDVTALPLLRDLELCLARLEDGPELQGLAALTAMTRLHLPNLVAKSAPPDSLECFSRLQALQDFGAPSAELDSASILRFISALTALSVLHLRGVNYNERVGQVHWQAEHDALLEIASRARGLKELRYSYECVTADGFSCLTRLTQLTVLNLINRLHHLSERDLRRIVALPCLRQLALIGEGCARVPPLGALTALEHLSLDIDEPSGLRRVAGLTGLTRLRLHLQLRPTAGLGLSTEALATLSSLRELALSNICFDSAAGAAVCALRGLWRLSLVDCKVTDVALGALTQLLKLTLRRGDTEAGTMSQLALLTGLRALAAGTLSNRLFDCAGIVMLTQLTRLKLKFEWQGDSPVQLPSLIELPRLSTLQDLTVSAPSIGQQGLESMAALPLLTRLCLFCSSSCTGTVSRLTALQRLVKLALGFPPFVAAEELAALACALPELRHLFVTDLYPWDTEVLARLEHLRGNLFGAEGQDVELGFGR